MNDLYDAAASQSPTAGSTTQLGGSSSPPDTLELARAAQRQLADIARQADESRGQVLQIFSAIEAHRQAGIPTTFDVATELEDTSDRLLDLLGRIHSSCDPYAAWADTRPAEAVKAVDVIPLGAPANMVTRLDVHGADDVEHFAMMSSATDAVIGLDANGRIITWNSAAERLYGWSRSEAVGNLISLIASADAAEAVQVRCDKVLAGETVEPFTDVRRHRDGTMIEVRITPTAIFTADGTVVAAVAVHTPNRRHTDAAAA
jgi:PAS domain S-box-containing protein